MIHKHKILSPLGNLPKFSNRSIPELNQAILTSSLNLTPFVFISINMFTLDLIYNQKKFPQLDSNFTYTIDSRILYFLLRILKPRISWRHIPGADIPVRLLKGKENFFRVLLVGASTETNRKVIEKLKDQKIYAVGDSAIVNEMTSKEYAMGLCKTIDEHRVNLVILCLGQPKQEFLALDLVKLGAHIPILCVGAFADFYSGSNKRSPKILNKLGLEWSWRLVTQPGRMWKRYLIYSLRGLYIVVFRRVRHDKN